MDTSMHRLAKNLSSARSDRQRAAKRQRTRAYPPAHGRTNRPRGGKIASALPEEPIARSGVVCVMEDVQHPVPDGVPQSQAVLVRELEVNTSVNAAATRLIGGLGELVQQEK